MSRLTYSIAGALLVVALSACSNNAPDTSATPSSPGTSSPTSAATPTAAKPTAAVPAGGNVSERCGVPDAPARWITLRGPGGVRLAAVVVGRGPVTAVYAHQTGGEGLCGFWAYAQWLAEQRGVRSVLVDFCGVGGSVCELGDDFFDDQPAQLTLAVEWARAHGGREVSLVGASLGGTVASVTASTTRPRVDAVVNLSGPVEWDPYDLGRAMPRLTMPTLLALAPDDPVASVPHYRRLIRLVPGRPKRFVVADSGHGWDLLGYSTDVGFRPTALARTVADWVSPATAPAERGVGRR